MKVLLKAYEPKLLPLNAVYPSRRFVSLKVRAMIDFLAHELEMDPVLSGTGQAHDRFISAMPTIACDA